MRFLCFGAAWVGAALLLGCAGHTLDAAGAPGVRVDGGATQPGGTLNDAGDAVLFIDDVLVPTTPSNGVCSYAADPTQLSLTTGNVDVSFAGLATYAPYVLVGNRLPTNGSEVSRLTITSAETRITTVDGGDIVSLLASMCSANDLAACATGQQHLAAPTNPFSTVESVNVADESTVRPSYSVMALTLIDSATMTLVRAYFENELQLNSQSAFTKSITLQTSTVVSGMTLGGIAVQSPEFAFPVTFGFGNLASNLKSDPSSVLGYCVDTAALSAGHATCVPGQDVASDATSGVELPACPGS
jgi:hypothetical protein